MIDEVLAHSHCVICSTELVLSIFLINDLTQFTGHCFAEMPWKLALLHILSLRSKLTVLLFSNDISIFTNLVDK